jgi:hypothetical protein
MTAQRQLLPAIIAGLCTVLPLASVGTQAPAPPGQAVVVTDFGVRPAKEVAQPSIREAICAMAKDMPTSRAIATCPISGQQVRVIRTGARWVAVPRDAVFLLLGKQEPGPDMVFPSQQQFVQYLVRHPEAAKHRPKPLRLHAALKEILPPKPSSPTSPTSSTTSSTSSPAPPAGTP